MASALIVQGGGPTAVLNASLVAAVRQARDLGRRMTTFLGSVNGVKGILSERFVDLFDQDKTALANLAEAPGAALGSSREALTDADAEQMISIFRRREIRWLFVNGGNGSMSAALTVERAAKYASYELHVIGIPKTVDNDLCVTDHSPGYGSAGRFWAHATRDMGLDHRALPSPILVAEVIGRNVGWVVAATAFARAHEDDAPHLIYCPERRLPRAKLLNDVEQVYRRLGRVFICVCEGQLDENGEPFGVDVDRADNPHARLAKNLGYSIARLIEKEMNLRTRSERPSLLGRSCSGFVSEVDRREAELCGREAVRSAAVAGESGKMVALQRHLSERYSSTTCLVSLADVAGKERKMAQHFISESGSDVTPAFLKYASPLVGEVKTFPRLY